ncbi:ABC transporter permease subunit [Vibrio fluvialis]|uniref:ABC transporter permease subunit n=1 Tax=Vibrio fluvialis TaxID=676 RepID=UPI00159A6CC4|nr:ABC transporter permease subunit [Vibrio fluvialis]MBY7912458.1 ABC transporter permease subunit [Vibrio fluvialis]QKE33521.1 ABC transporter permease subunit [Vibrio fluvialis]
MAQAEFSLKERDRKRLIKDRLVRLAVTGGGVSVLGALILIFVYLAMVVFPLFSDAELETGFASQPITTVAPKMLAIDEYGENAFVVGDHGKAEFWSLNHERSLPRWSESLPFAPVKFTTTTPDSGWFAATDTDNHVYVARPQFTYSVTKNGRVFTPELEALSLPANWSLIPRSLSITQLSAAVTDSQAFLAVYQSNQQVSVHWVSLDAPQVPQQFTFSSPFEQLDQMLLTPDGKTLYLRSGSELVIAELTHDQYRVRDIVDLSQGQQKHAVQTINLLSGAYSLLVTHRDGLVTQWFDVLKQGERHLTLIRDFKLASEVTFLLPDTYRKGFYSFYRNGTVQSHYTTSEKLVIFERAYQQAPALAAMSSNERYLATYDSGRISVAKIDNGYPEVSFSSLWQKVWYESYPEPQYVWQSTSASDEFEAKFSLVPIAFGTLKAALYAMLFAVPVAVFGAIYTAYFMAPKMRRVVKPTIELMEALPTVIIGFLAGLWFAPLVESHLTSIVALFLFLPLSTVIIGLLWSQLPKTVLRKMAGGWHALILIPVLLAVATTILSYSSEIELWLFSGDVRVYLAQHGIDFDQRNALVVGFAMGFAVIPTIFTIAEDAIFSVPKHLSDGSLALGATPWQTLTHVVLLTASPGIFSAVMMGLGRAVGETMIVLMATGNTPILDWNILEGMRTLSATIAVELPESEVGSSHFRILFLAALLLFIFTFAVNSLAEWVRQRLRAKYRAL